MTTKPRGNGRFHARALIWAGVLMMAPGSEAVAISLQWTRQLGTADVDKSTGVSADGFGNVYIAGATRGSIGGPNAGSWDAFIAKYDSIGALEWIRQSGTEADDAASCISADRLGNVFVAGDTAGSWVGPNLGNNDAFVAKYDAVGTLQWMRQFGTANIEHVSSVSADGLGNVYISGWTDGSLGGPHAGSNDAFLAKYDADGVLQWVRQLGTASFDVSNGISADGFGSVYIAGITGGTLGGPNAGSFDAFIAKYDAVGTLQWKRQLGTTQVDTATGVSADGVGNVYISGETLGSIGGSTAGYWDVVVAKFDADGTLQWTRQNGTSTEDVGKGVAADGLGNVYIVGHTQGSFGAPIAGLQDAILLKYAADGSLLWTRQIGTAARDIASSVSADGFGSVYTSGATAGSLGGLNVAPGTDDAFLIKFTEQLGDFDGNGHVDAADYIAWRAGLGTTYTQADYDVWRSRFGEAVGSSSGNGANTVLPEPAGTWPLILAAGAAIPKRRFTSRVVS